VLAAVFVAGCNWVIGELPEPASGTGGLASTGGSGGTSSTAGSGGTVSNTGGALNSGGASNAGGASNTGGTGGVPMGSGGAGGAIGCPCDCDEDGDRSEDCAGGTDCDDNDPDVHTGQPKYFFTAQKNVGFDYDCSGSEDPEYPAIKCDVTTVPCDSTVQGFFDTLPGCGTSAGWGSCVKTLGVCGKGSSQNKTLSCK
jgi:hypothetical protein